MQWHHEHTRPTTTISKTFVLSNDAKDWDKDLANMMLFGLYFPSSRLLQPSVKDCSAKHSMWCSGWNINSFYLFFYLLQSYQASAQQHQLLLKREEEQFINFFSTQQNTVDDFTVKGHLSEIEHRYGWGCSPVCEPSLPTSHLGLFSNTSCLFYNI